MENNVDVKSVLEELGYKLVDCGDSWRTSAIYRGGDNPTAVKVYKNTGVWTDYVHTNKSMPLAALVQRTLNTNDPKILNKYITTEKNSLYTYNNNTSKIQMEETYSEEHLERLLPHYKFYNSKNISDATLKFYKCGLATTGAMNKRYVFPIYNESGKICGFSGRDATNYSDRPKWKHMGKKTSWSYPLYIGRDKKLEIFDSIYKNKEVILVESIGDMLALWEAGIKNTIVTFGLKVTAKIKQMLIAIRPNTIHIAFNNDANRAGNEGANKAYAELSKHFDTEQISISLPTHNDFGEMSRSDILLWKSQNNL